MDRVTNLDVGGLRGMLDSMGHRAFGNDWKNVRSNVTKRSHLNRFRGALAGMTQHSPLTFTQLSGRGSKTKVSFTADFEKLTYLRVSDKMLSSPSMEITKGSASVEEHNRQVSTQGALGGRGGDVNDGMVLGEAIAGANQTVRDNDGQREQERVAVATKFEQPMAIFEGWVRIDGTMTGTKATVHESGLFRVEIAIPLTELQGAREHQDDLPPTFTRDAQTGFVDDPSRNPPSEPVHAARPIKPDTLAKQPLKTMGSNVITSPSGSRPASPGPSRVTSPVADPRMDPVAIELSRSPTSSVASSPHSDGPLSEFFSRRDRFDSPTAGLSPVDSRASSSAPGEGAIRQSTVDSATPLLSGRRETVDSATPLVPRHQETVDSATQPVPALQDTVDSEPSREIGLWTTPGLRDIADGWTPPHRDWPDPPDWQWKPRAHPPAEAPSHALLSAWHPSDMLVGIDPASGLVEAFRDDLGAAVGSSLDDAIDSLSDEFGPRVLAARLTHESGQEWRHEIPVPGAKITVKVRPERMAETEYVGPSKKFETDVSIEAQSSAAHTHGAGLRSVIGARGQVPVAHGSVSAQVTYTGSIRPKVDIEDHGILGLSGANTPNLTGDIEHRVPARTRTTDAHELYRQPIRFHISYEQHVVTGRRLTGIPESPQTVRLHGVFSYPKDTIPTPSKPTPDEEGRSRRLEVNQAVVVIRPFGDPGPAQHAESGDGGRNSQDLWIGVSRDLLITS